MQAALSSTDADMYLNSTLSTDIPNRDEIDTSLAYSIDTWIWYICPPFILTLGTFGNIMILIAYRRLKITPISMFMIALAITDLFFLYIVVFTAWISVSFHVPVHDLHDVTCKLSAFILYALRHLSAWLTASMTVQRAVSVVWPLRSGLMCTRTKTLYLIIGMLCFVLALNSHTLYGFGLNTSNSCSLNKYHTFFYIVWFWVDLICASFLPFVLIVISNCVLVWKMRTSMKRIFLVSDQSVSCEHHAKRNATVTRTLIAVSIVFFILTSSCNLLIIINKYYFVNLNDYDVKDALTLTFHVTLLLWYSNSAVNFYIYYVCGTVFRTEVKRLLCGCSHQSAQTQSTHITQSATRVQVQNTRL